MAVIDFTEAAQALAGASQEIVIENLADGTFGNVAGQFVASETGSATFNVFSQVGNIASETAAGAASTQAAVNQLASEALYSAETGSLTITTGSLAAGATTGAALFTGAAAAFGGITLGVEMYKSNPQFWTDLSQKLLPFAYKDPQNKSWGEIFQEALFPTAVDAQGVTYVPDYVLQALMESMVNGGFFEFDKVSAYTNNNPVIDQHYWNKEVNASIMTVTKTRTTEALEDAYYTSKPISVCAFRSGTDRLQYAYVSNEFFTWRTGPSGRLNDAALVYSQPLLYRIPKVREVPIDTDLPDLLVPYVDIDSEPWWTYGTIGLVLYYGTRTELGKFPDTGKYPGAEVPDSRPLEEQYPDWFNGAKKTVNPEWNPKAPESEENPKYTTWLPLQFPDGSKDGITNPDESPEDVRKGEPTPDNKKGLNEDYDRAINDNVLPNPNPNPDTEQSLNPDPQPDPSPDPTPEPTDPETPGKTPTPEPTPGIPSIGGGSSNALWKIYNPSHSILQAFGAWLWSDNPIKLIKEIFGNNPSDGIIGLHMIYVNPPIGGTANIKVGYVDSGVASPWVSQQYVTIDCGSVVVPMRYQSALDFGYTKVYCYLPFIGIVPLDSFDIIGKTVNIKYTVDILTGTVLAQISVSLGSYSAVLYTFNGSCSVEYPLTSGSRASQMLSLVTGAVGGAVVGGAGGALLGGIRGAASGADVRMSGNISGNAGAMGIRKPYIIVKRPVEVAARNYPAFYGYPANITGRLNSFSGYTRVKEVHVDNISGATAEEKREIESLLKSGVIV